MNWKKPTFFLIVVLILNYIFFATIVWEYNFLEWKNATYLTAGVFMCAQLMVVYLGYKRIKGSK